MLWIEFVWPIWDSPDNTSGSNLKNYWKIFDGKGCLLKGDSNPFRQQPFKEVIATGIMKQLGMAPIYGSGSSLGYDKLPGQICAGKDVVCKPFKNHHDEQLSGYPLLTG